MANLGLKIIDAFEKQDLCDVKIELADGTTLGAHRTVLMLGSDWFKTRLNQNWDHENPIRCTDFAPLQTRAVIEFLYRNDIDLSIENVFEVLQASDFYIIPDLIDKCANFLCSCISNEKVLLVINTAHAFNLDHVLEKALRYTDHCFEKVYLSNIEAFCSLDVNIITMMIKRDTLSIHEEKLFDILCNWVSSENRDVQATWQILVPFIRFGRMSAEFLIEKVVYKDVIDNNYAMKVMSYLTSLQVQRNSLSDGARSSRKCISLNDVEVVRFFEQSPESTWTSDSLNGDRISFSVNVDIDLRGVILFGRLNTSLFVEVTLYVENDFITRGKIRQDVLDVSTFPFIFPNVSHLQKDTMYTIVVNMSGGDCFFGIDGLQTVQTTIGMNRRVKVKFYNTLVSNTNIRRGQIKGLILC
ncbi:BTB/POZ domain-containing protein 3-like [Saccostrea echinata]|uniref:BTB/POZ domain-containing protein 3-like n=1 Tax=Saccostrea echinata TaxID=191078 RepID=UPI002A7F13C6|nr:BTB/POZ domain-containing protein 3-like [Saccostrea echinata]